MMRLHLLRVVAVVFGLAAVVLAMRAALAGPEAIDVREHHLLHAALIFGGIVTALALSSTSRQRGAALRPERPAWLVPAMLAPLAAMVFMVPSFYPALERHPAVHGVAHLGFVVAGFGTAWCGERYRSPIGWATSLFLEVMAVVAAFGFGVISPIVP